LQNECIVFGVLWVGKMLTVTRPMGNLNLIFYTVLRGVQNYYCILYLLALWHRPTSGNLVARLPFQRVRYLMWLCATLNLKKESWWSLPVGIPLYW